jgi:hypothetical protein
MESVCDLGDDFGADYSWNPNQAFQIVLDLASLFPYTTSNVLIWWKCREHLYWSAIEVFHIPSFPWMIHAFFDPCKYFCK